MDVFADGGLPIKSWAVNLEDGCAEQARNISHLPMLFRHVALMPDAHQGFGMCIGGVAALSGAVSPSMVGVDIGCGMRAFPLDCTVDEFMPKRESVMHEIQRAIPTGFNHHREAQEDWYGVDSPEFGSEHPVLDREYQKSLTQLGTLGGGNHFIEVQADEDGGVWFTLHSGSRNVGLQVAKHYNALAVELNERWHSSVPKEHELAFLPLDSDEGQAYLAEMNACLTFAYKNREHMMHAIQSVLYREGFTWGDDFDVHHNYAAMENHFGKNVMVHRKGAARAREGARVIIPGSMGSHSYLGVGKGNHESFTSCSHGAGRTMGRKAAIREIPAEQVIAEMKAADISLFKPKRGDVAEECRQAYKNIDAVMDAQADLVTPVTVLRPLAVIKA
jgi:tRNA-splicing ligase RtcB